MGATSNRVSLWLLLVACSGPEPVESAAPSAEAPIPKAPVEVRGETLARSATRCAECHADIAEQWSDSAHANAAKGELYTAMVRDIGPQRAAAECDRCHRPLAAAVDAKLPVVGEGVTCDVCHSIADVEVRSHDAAFTLALASNVKYGPYCDAKDHYFHKMGCSPVHEKSQFCAACHLWDIDVGGATIPVLEEYREWAKGPEAETYDCQDCHMDRVDGEVAVGWSPRPGVNHHGLFGEDDARRSTALDVDARARKTGDAFVVSVTLRNTGSAHYVPSGIPGRSVVVTARALDRDGAVVGEAATALGRNMLDDAGNVVAFYRATRVGEDTRIAPQGERSLELTVPVVADGRIELDVALRRLDHAITTQLGVDPPDDIPLAAGHLDVARTKPGAFLREGSHR